MTKVYYIGLAVNARTRHTHQIKTDRYEDCFERMCQFCSFWDISHFTISKVEQTFYKMEEDEYGDSESK